RYRSISSSVRRSTGTIVTLLTVTFVGGGSGSPYTRACRIFDHVFERLAFQRERGQDEVPMLDRPLVERPQLAARLEKGKAGVHKGEAPALSQRRVERQPQSFEPRPDKDGIEVWRVDYDVEQEIGFSCAPTIRSRVGC